MIKLSARTRSTDKPKPHAVRIAVHELGPRQRLRLPKGEHAVVVQEGVLHVVREDDEVALIAGDEIVLRQGAYRVARNATGGTARVVALSRAA
jgi:hypothetical protein